MYRRSNHHHVGRRILNHRNQRHSDNTNSNIGFPGSARLAQSVSRQQQQSSSTKRQLCPGSREGQQVRLIQFDVVLLVTNSIAAAVLGSIRGRAFGLHVDWLVTCGAIPGKHTELDTADQSLGCSAHHLSPSNYTATHI